MGKTGMFKHQGKNPETRKKRNKNNAIFQRRIKMMKLKIFRKVLTLDGEEAVYPL